MNKWFKLTLMLLLISGIGYSQSDKVYWLGNEPDSKLSAAEVRSLAEFAEKLYAGTIVVNNMEIDSLEVNYLFEEGTFTSGGSSIYINDVYTQIDAVAYKSILSELTYTPQTAGVDAPGTACPIAIVGRVNLSGDIIAANTYPGMGWGVQGQMHIVTGSTIDGSTYGSPGAIYAGVRGVVTDGSGSSTYTKGILAGVYAEIQMNQSNAETNSDFDIYGIYIRNQGVATSPDLTAGLYMDVHTVTGGSNFEIGIDINDAVIGIDIGTATTGIDFSGSMTQEIIGQNDEIISNANDGEWDFGIAKIATTGSGRGTDQYEFVFDVSNRDGGIFPNGGPYKTYIYNTEVDREADEDATGDSRDVMFKGVYRNYGQNANTLHVQGIGTTVRNESGGTLGSMKGGEFSVNNKQGATVNAQLYGITATVENYATPGSDIIAGLFEIRNEGTNATHEWGIHITNTNNSQADAADAAIYIDDVGANIGWGYGLDMSGATIQTAEIIGSNDETISNTNNGDWDFGDANLVTSGTLEITRTTSGAGYTSDIFTEWTAGADMAGGSDGIYSIAHPDEDVQNAYALRGRMHLVDATGRVDVNQLHAVDALINLNETQLYDVVDNLSVFGGAIHGAGTGDVTNDTGDGSMNIFYGVIASTVLKDFSITTNGMLLLTHPATYLDYGVNIQNSGTMIAGLLLNNHGSEEPATMTAGIKMISAAGNMVNGIDMSEASFTGSEIITSSGAKIFSGSAATGNAVWDEVGDYDATGSIYLSTAGAMYIQVANTGANTDWFNVQAADDN